MGIDQLIFKDAELSEQTKKAIEIINQLREENYHHLAPQGAFNLWWSDFYRVEVNRNGGVVVPQHIRERYNMQQDTEVHVIVTPVPESENDSIIGTRFEGKINKGNSVVIPKDKRKIIEVKTGDKVDVQIRKAKIEHPETIKEFENVVVNAVHILRAPENEEEDPTLKDAVLVRYEVVENNDFFDDNNVIEEFNSEKRKEAISWADGYNERSKRTIEEKEEEK